MMRNSDQLAAALGDPNAGFAMIGHAARGFFGLLGIDPEMARYMRTKRSKANTSRGKATRANSQRDVLASQRRRLAAAEASLKSKPRKRSAAKTRKPYRGGLHLAAELEKRRQILNRLSITEGSRDLFPSY